MTNKIRRLLVLLLIILKEAGPTAACSCSSLSCVCSSSGLTGVPQDLPTTITELYLNNNAITTLNQSDFSRYSSLIRLYLRYNQISDINSGAFNLPRLTNLHLYNNQLTILQSDMFVGLDNLEYLYLFYNNIHSIEAGTFNSTPQLRELKLDRNNISNIAAGTFVNLPGLEILYLSYNRINTFPSDLLLRLTFSLLSDLRLNDNQLETLPAAAYDILASVSTVFIIYNPWQCDCRMLPFKQRMNGTYPFESQITCAGPANLAWNLLRDVNPDDLGCEETTTEIYSSPSTSSPVIHSTTNFHSASSPTAPSTTIFHSEPSPTAPSTTNFHSESSSPTAPGTTNFHLESSQITVPSATNFQSQPSPTAPSATNFHSEPSPTAPSTTNFHSESSPTAPSTTNFHTEPSPTAPSSTNFHSQSSSPTAPSTTNFHSESSPTAPSTTNFQSQSSSTTASSTTNFHSEFSRSTTEFPPEVTEGSVTSSPASFSLSAFLSGLLGGGLGSLLTSTLFLAIWCIKKRAKTSPSPVPDPSGVSSNPNGAATGPTSGRNHTGQGASPSRAARSDDGESRPGTSGTVPPPRSLEKSYAVVLRAPLPPIKTAGPRGDVRNGPEAAHGDAAANISVPLSRHFIYQQTCPSGLPKGLPGL